jgi:hypothetical protein
VEPPTFDNQIATLRLDGRSAELRIERTCADEDAPGGAVLEPTLERRLA